MPRLAPVAVLWSPTGAWNLALVASMTMVAVSSPSRVTATR
jgi:hypothetical protein